MATANVAINGFGRIGRAAFKIALEDPRLKVVAINDLVPIENLEYLLKYDTVYGRYNREVSREADALVVGGQRYRVVSEPDATKLPWGDLGVDIVLECTGRFTSRADCEKHLQAGAKQVIISAPAKEKDVPTVVFGSNYPEANWPVMSTASCTTNCITPVIEVVGRRVGIEKAVMTTAHAYTASQSLVDGPKPKDMREGRAAAQNILPTSTGAAKATTRVLPQYEGRFNGVALRVPVSVGSISDVTMVTSRDTSVDEINGLFKEEASTERYEGIVAVVNDPIGSSDIIADSRASVIDPWMTQVIGGNLVKVMAWYDNEWGYASQMMRTCGYIAEKSLVPREALAGAR